MQGAESDARIQSQWSDWVRAHTRRAFRLSLWLVVAFYALFAPLDLLVTPAPLRAPYWVVRAAVVLVSLLCLRLSRAPLFDRAPAGVSAAYFLLVPVASLTWMVAQLQGPVAIYSGAISTAMLSLGVALLYLWPPRVALLSQAGIVLPFLLLHLALASREHRPISWLSAFFVVLAGTVAAIAQIRQWRSRREQVASHTHVELLERAERDARKALETQAGELARANEGLRELDRLKTDLIANVSHDLRTPLTLILTAFKELSPTLPDSAREDLEMGERNAARLLQLIDDLLALARLDAGAAPVLRVPFDLATVVRELAIGFGHRRGSALQVTGADEPLVVLGDPHMLASVLSNLLTNAFKFTDRDSPRVQVRLWRDRERAIFEVEDDGIGIAPEHLDRIFERFAQVEPGESRRFQGSGIGLAVVREIVAAHGGTITVTSEPGMGTTFHGELPTAAPEQTPVAASSSALAGRLASMAASAPKDAETHAPPAGGAGRSALVVEDNADMRRALARILGREYGVQTAADGAQGLAAARARPPDLVVTDEMMPGMSGSQMMAAMREDPALRHVPIIFLTARGDPDTRVRLLEAGADDLLVKPFHEEELLARSRRLVEASARARQLLQTNRDLDLFASTAAHDLQAPTRAVAGFAEHLRRSLGSKVEGPALAYLDHIEGGARRLTELIRGMLALARLAAAPTSEHLAQVDLAGLAAEVERDLATELEESGGVIVVGDLPMLRGDPGQLRQLVHNLVANGLKFHRPGVPPRVEIRAKEVDLGWEIAFADNGVGFEPEQSERVFEPLCRLHGAGAYPGTGLGLAICRRVVERHQGSIWAVASPGRGATFTVHLPAPSDGAQPAP